MRSSDPTAEVVSDSAIKTTIHEADGGNYTFSNSADVAKTTILRPDGGQYRISGEPTHLTVTSAPIEARFEAMQARLALLEVGLAEVRSHGVGPGHNQGPPFGHIEEDLSKVDDWMIALLKEKGPTPPSDPTQLIEQGEKAVSVAEKILSALRTAGIEMAKGAAREAGGEIAKWMGLAYLILEAFNAFKDWLL